ncbi:S8 family peptidase [Membranicola marinus]|uniref:S8 family peptidase n=1 Tax=Membranihabitans marinus TaxID=1227546 RepID=A0A953I198_9BACT|nr:S8 family peptidase [Membranihabitans marinus]MBY5959447.1 S8 family peptidase [Membranihabitans marinus]
MIPWKIPLIICLIKVSCLSGQETPLVDIHPLIHENFAIEDTLSCILVFRQQNQHEPIPVDLPKSEKTTRMFEGLIRAATHSQSRLLDSLSSWKVPHYSFYIINAVQARLDSMTLRRLSTHPDLTSILPDFPLVVPPEVSVPGSTRRVDSLLHWGISHIRADSVWQTGITGQGVVVAGLDTGMKWEHTFLKNNYRGLQNNGAVNHNHNWHDALKYYSTPGEQASTNPCGYQSVLPCDDHGHGTFTMGLITGVSEKHFTGIAPGTQWISSRIMDRGKGHLSTYLKGLEWCLAPTDLHGQNPNPALAPDIINNSWSCPYNEGCVPANYWLLDSATARLTQAGIFVVASAGNTGRKGCSSLMDPPAIFSSVFTVGATGQTDSITDFSSRGPVKQTQIIKPDVVAPGQGITSIYPNETFVKSSGTSISAPIAAGVAALVIEANPAFRGRPDLLRRILTESALPVRDNPCGSDLHPNLVYGFGRIDAVNAVQLAKQYQPTSTDKRIPPDHFLRIYPNPAQNYMYVENQSTLPVQGQLYDVQGQVITSIQLRRKETRKFKTAHLRPGVYFARLSTSEGVIVLKIMKI